MFSNMYSVRQTLFSAVNKDVYCPKGVIKMFNDFILSQGQFNNIRWTCFISQFHERQRPILYNKENVIIVSEMKALIT